jgi:hypothetical protein
MWTRIHHLHTICLTRTIKFFLALLLCGISSFAILQAWPATTWAQEENAIPGDQTPLAGQRVIAGTVEEVRGEQAKVDTGEGQPRFVPLNIRKEMGLPELKKGDQVEIIVNEQNLIVDVHVPGENPQHKVVRGTLAHPLRTGHDKAVIQSIEGKEESHFIRPLARSKVASIPVGTDAVFLIDEKGQIVDAIFSSGEGVEKAQHLSKKKSPLKASFKKVTGVLTQALQENSISIKPNGNGEQRYEVRPLTQEKFKNLSSGQVVVLFIDEENKVTDVSFTKEKP